MNTIKIFSIVFYLLAFVSAGNAQTLEIHQMSVGAADAAVIVVRDVARMRDSVAAFKPALVMPTNPYELLKVALQNKVNLKGTVKKVILIDAAENELRSAKKVDDYLKQIGVNKTLDYTILSHFDKDHYGGFNYLFGELGYSVKQTAYHPNNTNKKYPKVNEGWRSCYVKKDSLKGKTKIAVVNDTEIDLGVENLQYIKLTCVVADCYVLGEDPTVAAQSHCPYSNNSNDHSIGWVLQYGAFRFYTGGDLNGLKSTYMETYMVDSLKAHDFADYTKFDNTLFPGKGHTCAIKLNHHGSEYSTDPYFLSVLLPKTVFVPCGYKHGHPTENVILDLETPDWTISEWGIVKQPNYIEKYYVTSLIKGREGKVGKIGTADSKGIVGGDLVLIVDDQNIDTQSKFYVYANGKTSAVFDKDKIKLGVTPVENSQYFQCHKTVKPSYIKNHP